MINHPDVIFSLKYKVFLSIIFNNGENTLNNILFIIPKRFLLEHKLLNNQKSLITENTPHIINANYFKIHFF